VTQAIASSTSLSILPWGLVLVAVVLLIASILLWPIPRRRNPPVPVERLGLPSLAGGPFALAAGPGYEADAAVESAHEGAAEPRGTPAPSRWPFAPAVTPDERERSEDLARRMAEALHEIGPRPPLSETDHLAEQMALIILSGLRDQQDLGLNAGVALTACITDELSHELRQLACTSS
jgi:hypothetical protein